MTIHHPSRSTLQAALIIYIKQLKPLASQEATLLNTYSSVTGTHYKSDAITEATLKKLVPRMNIFISKIEAITPTDSRILAVHNLFIAGWNLQDAALIENIGAN